MENVNERWKWEQMGWKMQNDEWQKTESENLENSKKQRQAGSEYNGMRTSGQQQNHGKRWNENNEVENVSDGWRCHGYMVVHSTGGVWLVGVALARVERTRC